MLKLIYTNKEIKMLTEEQKINRRKAIGGSDVPIIMGYSSFKTPVQLWLEKRGELVFNDAQSPQAYWGSMLEDIVRQEFIKRHNVYVEQPDTITHPKFNYLQGNLDGFILNDNAVLEIKTANAFSAHEWGQEGQEIPQRYVLQIAYYCMLKNAPKAYCAVLIGGQDYREYVYHRNEWLEDEILNACHEFWGMVQSGEQPPPQHEDMKHLYKATVDKSITYNMETLGALDKLTGIKKNEKLLKVQRQEQELVIQDYMKDSEFMVDEDGRVLVSWKANARGTRTFLVKE